MTPSAMRLKVFIGKKTSSIPTFTPNSIIA
jgi:hypothetical protein